MNKKVFLIAILAVVLIASYMIYVKNLQLRITFLHDYCKQLSSKDSIQDVSIHLNRYYSEELGVNQEGYKEKLFGISKSRFDPFCVVQYNENGEVIKTGFSFD